ncbi:transposable element Tcb2 transposase [Trichonephila clavipes]|nr:transposable element Tcb2 transposase [Trichonephila clavipes]
MSRYAGRRNGGVSELYKACCRCKISISGKEIARRIAAKITPSCCLSKKWRIINLLDDIWMLLPEVESLGSRRKAERRNGSAVPFHDDNAPCHRTVVAEQLLESEDIERMDWPARSPDLNPIEHVWDFRGRRLAARTLPPVTIRELRLALQDEWAAMPHNSLTPSFSAWADAVKPA